ncbi:MAG: VOC family protein [Cyclobacteriaceae bacterium]|nr:VOC family protein [Cyclobacteriaceae bacterium]
MKIDHLAIWVSNLNVIKDFYEKYFQASAGDLYNNPEKQFRSYFLSFPNSNTRLEIMAAPNVIDKIGIRGFEAGMAHFAISVGSREMVDQLTEQLRSDQHSIVGEPRITGDGYYESVVLDPEGNRLEITA